MIIRNAYLIKNQYCSCNEDLKMKHIMYILKKSTKLNQAVMMIIGYNHLMVSQHIHIEEMLLKYAKVRC